MTTELFTPHPLATIHPGDVIWTWCSKHMDRTTHLWDGHKLICVECHPELKSKQDADDQ